MKKRLLMLIPVALLILCLLPTAVFAGVGDTFTVQSSDEPSVAVTMKVLEMPTDSTPGKVQVGNGTEAAVDTSVKELTLPEIIEDSAGNEYTVTAVGEYAFENCSALTSVSFPQAITLGVGAFYLCEALESVNLPQVKEIGEAAFNTCSALQRVSLPKVMTIGDYAFNDCIALKSVTIWQMDAPFVGSEPFSAVPSDCTLYVPYGAEGYTTENGWPGNIVDLYAVSGTVYTTDKKPIVGSTVTVGDTSTLSDDKGAYTVYVEKNKETTITATKADLSEWSIVVKNEGTALTGQDIIFDTAAMPQFSLESGAYIDTQSLTLSCATVGATIRYTTNGEEPTETKGAIYDEAAPILITETTTIKARAFKEGLTPSAVVTRDYVINAFTDISKDDWFSDDVMFVLQEGLMIGTDDTAFSPNAIATRGMIVTVLYRLAGEPEVSGACPFTDVKPGISCPFTDVKPGIYYEDAMTWAASVGIVNGYGNGQCGPEDSVTREQLATMMYRYADYKKYDITAEAELSKYSDANEISSYAETAMSWAVGNGLIKGKTDATLAPKDSALRSEVAAILHRFCVAFVK